jgi:hypothetical protein
VSEDQRHGYGGGQQHVLHHVRTGHRRCVSPDACGGGDEEHLQPANRAAVRPAGTSARLMQSPHRQHVASRGEHHEGAEHHVSPPPHEHSAFPV